MLIKNASLQSRKEQFDLLIEEGIITKIDRNIECDKKEIIDAKGRLVLLY